MNIGSSYEPTGTPTVLGMKMDADKREKKENIKNLQFM